MKWNEALFRALGEIDAEAVPDKVAGLPEQEDDAEVPRQRKQNPRRLVPVLTAAVLLCGGSVFSRLFGRRDPRKGMLQTGPPSFRNRSRRRRKRPSSRSRTREPERAPSSAISPPVPSTISSPSRGRWIFPGRRSPPGSRRFSLRRIPNGSRFRGRP